MIIEQRHERLLEQLRRKPDITVRELAGLLFVSEPTVRRDLTELEKRGFLRKVYGRALLTAGPADGEIPFVLRENEKSRAKAELGRRAASLLRDGMVVMLDGSTSAFHLVPYLASLRDLIVITSGAKTAIALAEAKVRVYSTGGEMILNSYSYVGRQAESALRAFHGDICFFSCRGVREDGLLTDKAVEEVNLRRTMLEQCATRVLLATSDKLGQTFFYTQGHTEEVDAVLCDVPLPPTMRTRGG